MAKPKSRAKPRPDVPHGGSPQLRSTVGKTDVGTGSLPVRQYSSDINEGSFPGFETSASFPGSSTSLYPSNPPPPLSHSEMQQQQPETSYFVRPGKKLSNYSFKYSACCATSHIHLWFSYRICDHISPFLLGIK